jgi:hypothetical protein
VDPSPPVVPAVVAPSYQQLLAGLPPVAPPMSLPKTQAVTPTPAVTPPSYQELLEASMPSGLPPVAPPKTPAVNLVRLGNMVHVANLVPSYQELLASLPPVAPPAVAPAVNPVRLGNMVHMADREYAPPPVYWRGNVATPEPAAPKPTDPGLECVRDVLRSVEPGEAKTVKLAFLTGDLTVIARRRPGGGAYLGFESPGENVGYESSGPGAPFRPSAPMARAHDLVRRLNERV